jgi:hypothetical protein
MNMSDAQLDELLGAYALDAVDDDERREIEAYLSANPRARAEVDSHRRVAAMLAVGDQAAPKDLWNRIASALPLNAVPLRLAPVDEFNTTVHTDLVDEGPIDHSDDPMIGSWRRPTVVAAADLPSQHSLPGEHVVAPVIPLRRRSWRTPAALAAAAACVAGMFVVNARQSNRIDRLDSELAVAVSESDQRTNEVSTLRRELEAARSQSDLRQVAIDKMTSQNTRKVMLEAADPSAPAGARVEVAIDETTGYLQAIDLPALPDGKVYQLWGVIDEQVISLGVLGPQPRLATFTATGPLTQLVLTVEDGAGVPVSSQPAFLAGTLS